MKHKDTDTVKQSTCITQQDNLDFFTVDSQR